MWNERNSVPVRTVAVASTQHTGRRTQLIGMTMRTIQVYPLSIAALLTIWDWVVRTEWGGAQLGCFITIVFTEISFPHLYELNFFCSALYGLLWRAVVRTSSTFLNSYRQRFSIFLLTETLLIIVLCWCWFSIWGKREEGKEWRH